MQLERVSRPGLGPASLWQSALSSRRCAAALTALTALLALGNRARSAVSLEPGGRQSTLDVILRSGMGGSASRSSCSSERPELLHYPPDYPFLPLILYKGGWSDSSRLLDQSTQKRNPPRTPSGGFRFCIFHHKRLLNPLHPPYKEPRCLFFSSPGRVGGPCPARVDRFIREIRASCYLDCINFKLSGMPQNSIFPSESIEMRSRESAVMAMADA